ncbi:cupin domain-containing protein [Negadavirga shengliensis]|uniref:Cupin domain-containing protein n=1 Tax=Negadavirga shengliensis TaxID=1389218 RepID=A0ABV9T3B2_9BACT
MINPKLLFLPVLFCYMKSIAQPQPLPSSVYEWKMMPVEKSGGVERRHYFNWPTKTLQNFEIEVIDIQSENNRKITEIASDTEKLILVKNGTLSLSSQQGDQILSARSIALVHPGEKLSIYNAGKSPTSFFLIQWKIETFSEYRPRSSGKSIQVFDYQKLDYKENPKGGRRNVMEAATQTLHELEMHITTLLEGEKSHDPHVHPDEEIIVVLQGEVEEMINGTPYRLGPGSVIFLSSMDPHGIRNVGKGACEYYAIRWTVKD